MRMHNYHPLKTWITGCGMFVPVVRGCLVVLVMFAISLRLHAQPAITYNFQDTLSNGMAIYSVPGTAIISGPVNDSVSSPLYFPGGFTFVFYGALYSMYSVSANGYITLEGPAPCCDYTGAASSPNTISVFGGNLMATSSASSVQTMLGGVAPNRILEITWRGFGFYPDGLDTLSFALWLFESDGSIQMRYGNVGSPVSSHYVSVGFHGSEPSDYHVRGAGSDWLSSTASPAPDGMMLFDGNANPSGVVYTWTPSPPVCNASFTTAYDSTVNTFYLTVDSATQADAVSYSWNFGDGTDYDTAQYPTHEFSANGIYDVQLDVGYGNGVHCGYDHNIGIDSLGNVMLRAESVGFTVKVIPYSDPLGGAVPPVFALDIFPNPFSDGLQMALTGLNVAAGVKVTDVLGRVLYRTTLESGDGIIHEKIDLSGLSNGIYLITVNAGNTVYTRKAVKY